MWKDLFARVEWRIFFSTLGLVFLSEMGDKTQISTLFLASAKPNYVFWVALGSASALICTSFIEVIIGSSLARFLKPQAIRMVSAVVFITLGILLVFGVIGNIAIK